MARVIPALAAALLPLWILAAIFTVAVVRHDRKVRAYEALTRQARAIRVAIRAAAQAFAALGVASQMCEIALRQEAAAFNEALRGKENQ